VSTRSRRWFAALLVVAGALVGMLAGAPPSGAHALLLTSTPAAGAVLDEQSAPTVLRLAFSEEPEARLSSVAVTDERGVRRDIGTVVSTAERSLETGLTALERGVYTVTWRVLSRVDGHSTSGTFDFGVGVLPTRVAEPPPTPRVSLLELAGRWAFLAGLTLLLGSAVVPGSARQATAGWVVAVVGLAVLAEAQCRTASSSFAALWPTPVGRALAWRGVALTAAAPCVFGALVRASRHERSQAARQRRGLEAGAAAAAAAALAVHVAAGHAAGLRGWQWASVATQWAHAAAVAVWIGGLVALLAAVRGAPGEAKAAMVRRFSTAAAVALAVVVATGAAAGVRQVRSWEALTATSYGRAVVVKVALLAAAAALAGVNRWRNVRRAGAELRGLRWVSAGEVALASAALVTAAVLAGLSPPVAALGAPKPLAVTGHDAATSVTARLTTLTDRAGANRFTLRLTDRDSGLPVGARRARLDFRSLDDPSTPPTALDLRRQGSGRYVGEGNNLSVDGRWSVTVTADDVVVPLALTTASPSLFVTVGRDGDDPYYGVQLPDSTLVYFTPKPARVGRTTLQIAWNDVIDTERTVAWTVLTVDGRQYPVRRAGPGRFTADVELPSRRTAVTANAAAFDGSRLRAAFVMDLDA
jgi:putative copper export protein/methionine-rich copper-binding protein CopC